MFAETIEGKKISSIFHFFVASKLFKLLYVPFLKWKKEVPCTPYPLPLVIQSLRKVFCFCCKLAKKGEEEKKEWKKERHFVGTSLVAFIPYELNE